MTEVRGADPEFAVSCLVDLKLTILAKVRWSLKAVLIHVSLIAKDNEHLFRFLAHYLNGSFISLASLFSLYIVSINLCQMYS